MVGEGEGGEGDEGERGVKLEGLISPKIYFLDIR